MRGRDLRFRIPTPDCASLHPGYARCPRTRLQAVARGVHRPTALSPRLSIVRAIDYHSHVTVAAKTRMNVDQYLVWAQSHPGRYELSDGEVVAMSPESAGRAAVKFAVQRALLTSVQARRLPCHVLPDGMTVRVDETTAYEPDALVYCGARLGPSAMEVPNPAIVVEVLSPSTRRIDAAAKLAGYFRLPSVAHYLIVDPAKPLVVHHARGSGDTIITRVVTTGTIELDPPGMAVTLADIYAA